ncbi:Na+/H+ antiporter NhaC family protein [Algicola sagamiensis]|uniref:Na+/H+ antiporter NhaC family protein n=1 Tax=Algicola sagamiensis TaxID=163869 RepID=UPI0003616B3F|nr:Na+/H+ antiporter NhaC family protein [Algicola sagamiensis]
MEVTFSDSALSLLPAVLSLGLAIITRKVLLSLGCGILVGSLMLNQYDPLLTIQYIGNLFKGLFWSEDGLNTGKVFILLFLLLLGMMTSLMMVSGATRAFANWARKRIQTRRSSMMLTAFLGIFIFIDDYFNSLAVGGISRPLTDHYKVSRAKLAYLLDSTAASMCVIMPLSSWGAFIITVIDDILKKHEIQSASALGTFMEVAFLNYYAIFALIMVLFVAWFNLNLGPMAEEEKAAANGQLFNKEKGVPAGTITDLPEHDHGKPRDLIIPILTLIGATIFFMIQTGLSSLSADGKALTLMGALENTDVGTSLLYGAVCGVLITLAMGLVNKVSVPNTMQGLFHGAKSMLPAIYILLFAWGIGNIIEAMETGKYLSSFVQGNISPAMLPMILFILSGIMAFATGTSWGTFGIMLPIAGSIAATTDPTLMIPMLSAVLAGSIFGDHASPISDTTILSSTGASCHHIDHVVTQLPYAFIIAVVSLVGYGALGFTGSALVGYIAGGIFFMVLMLVLKKKYAE